MPPKQIEALKLALEALELLTRAWQTFDALDYGDNAITAIKEALAEHAMRETQRLGQEIEPVADYIAARDMLDAQPVPPRTWVGLTEGDMYVVCEEESCSFIAGAKWSEAILKEKNT